MFSKVSASLLLSAGLAASKPFQQLQVRSVASLNEASFEEAQTRDPTATRALSNVQIKTSSGLCLFVNELSGDFRANLTPVQVGACGSTDGQGWDFITAGKHNNVANSTLVVSTLTQACFNFDPRRAAGNQFLLFSCGGRADGGGQVTNSQLFPFVSGETGAIQFQPENQPGTCLTVKGSVIDVAACNKQDANQFFTPSGIASSASSGSSVTSVSAPQNTAVAEAAGTCPPPSTVTVTETTTVTASAGGNNNNNANTDVAVVTTAPPAQGSATGTIAGVLDFNPTTAVPVSGAGGTLQPTAVAQAQAFDNTAVFAFNGVSIKAPNGQCLFVNPQAGDFRENLAPVGLVDCAGSPNEQWGIVTKGKHNDGTNHGALIVSQLNNACVSFDGRRAVGDQITTFSCGGRGDGSGQTNTGQLVLFPQSLSADQTKLVFSPINTNNATCMVAGNGRVDVANCANDGTQVFTIVA